MIHSLIRKYCRARRLVASDLCSENKGSRFESSYEQRWPPCPSVRETGGSCRKELKKAFPSLAFLQIPDRKKISNLDGDIASAQIPFQKSNFDNSSQKEHTSRYQSFLVLFNFTGYLCFVQKYFLRDCLSKAFLQTLIKIKIGHVKVPGLMILCKHYFECLVLVKIWIKKVFNFVYWYFLLDLPFFSQMSALSRNLNVEVYLRCH